MQRVRYHVLHRTQPHAAPPAAQSGQEAARSRRVTSRPPAGRSCSRQRRSVGTSGPGSARRGAALRRQQVPARVRTRAAAGWRQEAVLLQSSDCLQASRTLSRLTGQSLRPPGRKPSMYPLQRQKMVLQHRCMRLHHSSRLAAHRRPLQPQHWLQHCGRRLQEMWQPLAI